MSISAISGSTSAAVTIATPTAIIPSKSEGASTPQPEPDSVKLSGAALAKSLKLSGQTPVQISQSMGVDIKTVDSYLGITTTTSTSVPAIPISAPTPPPQVKPATADTAGTPATSGPAKK